MRTLDKINIVYNFSIQFHSPKGISAIIFEFISKIKPNKRLNFDFTARFFSMEKNSKNFWTLLQHKKESKMKKNMDNNKKKLGRRNNIDDKV